ncbi:hypothetical protein I2I11_17640 [Pontibacter sp. 172403-2]|uniref:hypothetical protein n=1 Tax=Pontibacter rufus TaxID=2791028 RepID=UPI0018AFD738|nr:hypothetical protein [Pontibacter sp. 172403-2]MBF9255126.1 hypothetical protein [Pontibacter sp. 172403-2]
MKKIMKLSLLVFLLTAFTACGSQNGNTAEQAGTGAEADTTLNSTIDADTSVTLDPDTALYHDMTL